MFPSNLEHSTSRRYVFHTALILPRPPLAHPVLLSLPPHLPPVVMDQFHALLFERILVPQLMIGSRPFFAAAASGVVSGIVLDIGARGEGSEVSVVHESQVVEGATMRLPLDEGHLDDWLSYQLLVEDPTLVETLSAGVSLRAGLSMLVQSLKEQEDAIGFSSPFLAATAASKRIVSPSDAADEGDFDVAKLVADGKVDKIVGKKDKKKQAEGEEDGDYVEVTHPFDVEAEPIRIGLARHRYLEPLFLPHILADLAPSSNPTAQLLGLTEYEGGPQLFSGVQDAMGIVAGQVEDLEARRALWDGVVIVSSGCVAGIRGQSFVPLPLAHLILLIKPCPRRQLSLLRSCHF